MRAKRKFFTTLILTVLLLILPFTMAQAGGEFSWGGDLPQGWAVFTDAGELSQFEGSDWAKLRLKEQGHLLLAKRVDLKPETTYRITADIWADSAEGGAGINLNFYGQIAQTDAVYTTGQQWKKLSLYVRTNVDDVQEYILRVGLGSEDAPCKGTVYISAVNIQELSEQPAGETVYQLIGSLGAGVDLQAGDIIGNLAEKEVEPVYSAKNFNYNKIGTALFAVIVMLAAYFLLSGRAGARIGEYCRRNFAVILLVAVAVLYRVTIAKVEPGHGSDMRCFKGWAISAYEGGLANFYTSGQFADYPPAYIYVLYVIGWLKDLLGLAYDSAAFTLLTRLPAILADIALGYVVYRIASKHIGKNLAAAAGALLLFSPLLILNSAAWGQVDSIFLLPLIGCIYYLQQKRHILASAYWMLALLLKPQALLVAPLIGVVVLLDLFGSRGEWKKKAGKVLGCIAAMSAVYLALALPMMGEQDVLYAIRRCLNTAGSYDYASMNAFNFCALLGGNFVSQSALIFGVSFKTLGISGIVLTILLVSFLYWKRRERENLFLLSAILLGGIFTFGHMMHERYIILAIGLALLAALQKDNRRLLLSATVFCMIGFLNIYLVLQFGTDRVYDWLIRLLSLAEVAGYIWFTAEAIRQIWTGKRIPLAPVQEVFTPLPERKMEDAQRRLEAEPNPARKMKKKDYLLMLAITAVYAAAALTNLGSHVIPARAAALPTKNCEILLELREQDYIETLKYYAGYGQGDMRIYTSMDGEAFTEIAKGTVSHRYRNMFRWQMVEIGQQAKYILIVKEQGLEMEIREIGLMDESDGLVVISSAVLREGESEQEAAYLIDEQDQVPVTTSYMVDMYFDEIYHARTAYEYLEGYTPYEITHPPLGKAIITLGIRIFGFNPFGWRFMGAIFGIAMLPLLYVFAKRIFGRTRYAAIATVLFAADHMHFSLTRISTIDSYSIFFIIAMYFFMYEYMQKNFNREKLWKTLIPLGLCGMFFALGAATKWLCLYSAAGLCVLFFYTVFQRVQEYRYAKQKEQQEITKPFAKKLVLTLLFCVVVFLIIPALVYCASYQPYASAAGGEYGLKEIWENQKYMLNYHSNLDPDTVHAYSSSAYTWPFSIRPVFFFWAQNAAPGMEGVLWCMGNPILWWGGIAAMLYLLGRRKKDAAKDHAMPLVIIAMLTGFAPWLFITREVFIYHYFAVVPFLILLIVYAIRHLEQQGKWGRGIGIAFAVLCVLAFAAFYPANTGMVVPKVWLEAIRWLPTWPM